jgi:bifunctional polynucleotide phosphatase/kinase
MSAAAAAIVPWTVHERTLHVLGAHALPLPGLDLTQPVRVLGFDMDGTIIRNKSGKRFPVDRNDWEWWHEGVVVRIAKDARRTPNTLVCIFTNQAGVSKGKQPLADLVHKIGVLVAELKVALPATVPVLVCMATAEDVFRKPSLGMWTFVREHVLGGGNATIDLATSVYVGDAAGRLARWDGKAKTKKDHSGTDVGFARNVGLRFLTPDEYFLDQAPVAAHLLDPTKTELPASVRAVLAATEAGAAAAAAAAVTYADTSRQELVLLVAPPASGKSSFAERYFVPHGYNRINQDTLKTKDKCVRTAKEALAAGKSIVIDNTNPSAETRALYVAIARGCPRGPVPVRCIVLDTDVDLARHLNKVRELQTRGAHRHVPDIAYNLYKRDYVEPDAAHEGFAAPVVHVPFQPAFASVADLALFAQMT